MHGPTKKLAMFVLSSFFLLSFHINCSSSDLRWLAVGTDAQFVLADANDPINISNEEWLFTVNPYTSFLVNTTSTTSDDNSDEGDSSTSTTSSSISTSTVIRAIATGRKGYWVAVGADGNQGVILLGYAEEKSFLGAKFIDAPSWQRFNAEQDCATSTLYDIRHIQNIDSERDEWIIVGDNGAICLITTTIPKSTDSSSTERQVTWTSIQQGFTTTGTAITNTTVYPIFRNIDYIPTANIWIASGYLNNTSTTVTNPNRAAFFINRTGNLIGSNDWVNVDIITNAEETNNGAAAILLQETITDIQFVQSTQTRVGFILTKDDGEIYVGGLDITDTTLHATATIANTDSCSGTSQRLELSSIECDVNSTRATCLAVGHDRTILEVVAMIENPVSATVKCLTPLTDRIETNINLRKVTKNIDGFWIITGDDGTLLSGDSINGPWRLNDLDIDDSDDNNNLPDLYDVTNF